uniref:PPM-type phosphatase domain-containing protein n=1 Tax=Strongyloides papillosus TaxID=174720 RepID=A0A0N5CGS3_STREA
MGNESNHASVVETEPNVTDQNVNSKWNMNYHITACSKQGGRKYMEDRCQLDMQRNENGELEYIFAGVYDGHGGDEASKYTRQHLLQNIKSERGFLNGDDDEFLQAIKSGFLTTHDNMEQEHVKWKKHQNGYNSTAGTTVTAMFIRNKKLYVGHVGDSAIFIIKRDPHANIPVVEMATKEHKPNDQTELERITSCGGKVVKKSNCHRVVWQRSQNPSLTPTRPSNDIPFLAIARALGDFWSYNHTTNQYVVSPEPDCFTLEIDDSFMGVILCSDGVTGTLTESDIAKIITEVKCDYQDNSKNGERDYNNYARIIVGNALNPPTFIRSDNITAIAIMCEYTDKEDDGLVKENETSSTPYNLDEELTIYPKDCVIIKSKSQERIRTPEVELYYSGPKDPLYRNSTCVIGPGFEVEEEITNTDIERRVGETSDGGYIFYEKPCYVKVSKEQKKILDMSKSVTREDVMSAIVETIDNKVFCLAHGQSCRCCTKVLVRIDIAKCNILAFRKSIIRKEGKNALSEIRNVESKNTNCSDSTSKNFFSYFINKFPLFKFTHKKHEKSDIKHFNSLTTLPSQSSEFKKPGTFSRSFDNFERLLYVDEEDVANGTVDKVKIGKTASPNRPGKRKFNSTFCNKENSDFESNPPPEKRNRIWNYVSNLVSSLGHKNNT